MTLNRRNILGGAALAGLAASAAKADTPPPAAPPAVPPKPSLNERLAKAAREQRIPLSYDGKAFAGPGWDRIVEEGRASRFFLMGEEHGVAEVPALAGQLMTALKPAGYRHLGIEISPPIAMDMDRAALGGVAGLKRYGAEHPPGPAFYTWRPEMEMLARVRALFPAGKPVLWGMDYEVLQDRRLIEQLEKTAPASARPALKTLSDASKAAASRFAVSRNPGELFTFSGDPALVRAVIAAWPHPDPESGWVLETLEATLTINQHQVTERYHQANQTRADFNRANFVRHWNAATAATEGKGGRAPKVMFRMGGNHMMRGRSTTECYDLGNMIAECAALRGEKSFHLLVGPGLGAKQAAFNPSTFTSEAVPAETWSEEGVEAIAGESFAEGMTLIDLRPFRNWLPNRADIRVSRIVHGFDAMLVLGGSTPQVDG